MVIVQQKLRNLALTSLSLRQNSCVGKAHQHGALGVAYPKLAFQTPNNVFCLFALTSCKEFRDNRHFLALRLRRTRLTFASPMGDLLTEWPALSAISLRFEKTKGTVRAFGLNNVFCMFLEFFGRTVRRLARRDV